METSIRRQGEWTVVKISGRIELEKAQIFREACLKSLKNEKVVFELDRLQFVGSTGMTEFFECLHDIQKMKGCGVQLVGLSPDFKRFVAFTKASHLHIHETLEQAFKPQTVEINRDSSQDFVETEASFQDFLMNSELPRSSGSGNN